MRRPDTDQERENGKVLQFVILRVPWEEHSIASRATRFSVEEKGKSGEAGFRMTNLINFSKLWGMGLSLIVYYLTLGQLGQVHSGPDCESQMLNRMVGNVDLDAQEEGVTGL